MIISFPKIKHSQSVLLLGCALLISFFGCEDFQGNLKPVNLKCEYKIDPLGIDQLNPRLSWILVSDKRKKLQLAYRIIVASSKDLLEDENADLWDSGIINSDESLHILYDGKALISESNCFWKVMVWDEEGRASDWSEIGKWSMGLLNEIDWTAKWIGFDDAWNDSTYKTKPWANGMSQKFDYRPLPCPLLRKEFDISKSNLNAKLYVTAMGIYEVYINGHRVGNDYFTPGWTDYRKRIYYNTYDVSDLLVEGKNTISAILADGWYAGNIANRGQYYYGNQLRLKAQLTIEYKNHSFDTLITDETWKASYGPFLEADMQGGETFDARMVPTGWQLNGFDDHHWKNVVLSDTQLAVLQSYPGMTVQKIQELKPIEIKSTASGSYMVNMGQNFAGWVRIIAQGNAGDSIVMRFGEKLNDDGSLHTRNLRTARCTDTYVLKGIDAETWEPRFTYHGFQYVEINGYPGTLTPDKITGIVLHSNVPVTGQFQCSNQLINQIQSNIFWSQRSNYFDVPTDCPQRDERMGWTGDAQIFMRTASYNMDIAAFFNKWMVDVVDGQYDNGRFPSTAPRIYNRIAAGWGDAGIICPWNLFMVYNDTSILEKYYSNMNHWMDFLKQKSPEYISTLGSYGDWQNVESETPTEVVATAYFKRCSDLMSQVAGILNIPEDSIAYQNLSNNIKDAFVNKLVNDTGQIKGNTQTGYLMAISFDLLPDSLLDTANFHLLSSIREKDNHLTTGILGTNLLLPVLTELGHIDLAYKLLLNTDFPSWGHHIRNGSTTIWERWDSYSTEKGFHEDSTNSLNHYAYGSVGEWFYSTICGISSIGPGYKKIQIHPYPGADLTSAKATYNSIRGKIVSSWRIENKIFKLVVDIPANTEAIVIIPTEDFNSVTESGIKLQDHSDIQVLEKTSQEVSIQIGSGHYEFQSGWTVPNSRL